MTQNFHIDRVLLLKQISGSFVITKCNFTQLEQAIRMPQDVINKEDTNENSLS